VSIYERPTKSLMIDWVKQHLKPDQTFTRSDVVRWFAEHYPKIKRNTVNMHVDGMSTNNANRKHHQNVKPGSGHDLFYKMGPDQFRLWKHETDPAPLYRQDLIKQQGAEQAKIDADDEPDEGAVVEGTQEFAFERDLRNYLVKNLGMIEPGLHLYEEEGIIGVEFPVGGRFIDILAVDKSGGLL
jgi:endonuclease